MAPLDQGGGGVLSVGHLTMRDTVVRQNRALGSKPESRGRGGGIAAWGGVIDISHSWIDSNEADYGGGFFVGGLALARISHSTLSNNIGGGLHSHSQNDVLVLNSTLSSNNGGSGAIFNGNRDTLRLADGTSQSHVISEDGSTVEFQSNAKNLTAETGYVLNKVFVYDRLTDSLVSVARTTRGDIAEVNAENPDVNANGRFTSFESTSTLISPVDSNVYSDIYVFDRVEAKNRLISNSTSGGASNGDSVESSIDASG